MVWFPISHDICCMYRKKEEHILSYSDQIAIVMQKIIIYLHSLHLQIVSYFVAASVSSRFTKLISSCVLYFDLEANCNRKKADLCPRWACLTLEVQVDPKCYGGRFCLWWILSPCRCAQVHENVSRNWCFFVTSLKQTHAQIRGIKSNLWVSWPQVSLPAGLVKCFWSHRVPILKVVLASNVQWHFEGF